MELVNPISTRYFETSMSTGALHLAPSVDESVYRQLTISIRREQVCLLHVGIDLSFVSVVLTVPMDLVNPISTKYVETSMSTGALHSTPSVDESVYWQLTINIRRGQVCLLHVGVDLPLGECYADYTYI